MIHFIDIVTLEIVYVYVHIIFQN